MVAVVLRVMCWAAGPRAVPVTWQVVVTNLLEKVFRPLLAPGFTHNTTLEAVTLASHPEGDPVVLAINAISSALALSSVPWAGPVG